MTGAARFNFVNRRVKVPKGIGASGYRRSGYRGPDDERSRLYKSRNSERIAVVDLRKDVCRTIVQFGDPDTRTHIGERF
jgi:hypothetical protein